jgi:hypothetical protein
MRSQRYQPDALRCDAALSILAIVPLVLGACVGMESVYCKDDHWCPKGTKCSEDGTRCLGSDCGDGLVQKEEQCDPGSEEETASCNRSCTLSRCGDGEVNQRAGEACDPGLDNRESETCNYNCKLAKHGDGIVNRAFGEQCDGDNLENGNGKDCESPTCNYNCTPSRCGDGIANPSAGEECDRDGIVGRDGPSGPNGQSATCNINCTKSVCGDGVVNALAGENCDNGANNSPTGDCVSGLCLLNVCGDGFVNQTLDPFGHPREECDEGPGNSDTGPCLISCTKARCGDGLVQADVEDCDEGPSSAMVETACPYGLPTCAACSQCKTVQLTGPYCGDGKVNGGETCDDGHENGSTSCDYGTKICEICNANCSQKVARSGPYCGDRHLDPTERCDDGPKNGATTCEYGLKTCQICAGDCSKAIERTGAYCGDGTPNGPEACDDGPKNGANACDYEEKTCQICNADCSKSLERTGPYCGDGKKDDSEACDDGNKITETECPYGTQTCTTCNAGCSGKLALKGPYCGDEIQNESEGCDSKYSFVCGTCGAPGGDKACQKLVPPSVATGSITVASTNLAGLTFKLDDGVSPTGPFVFEFVDGGLPQAGHIAIDITASGGDAGSMVADATTIAARISAEIASAASPVITAAAKQQVVTLTNLHAGAFGNHAIVVAPAGSTALVVSGMSDGRGCPSGQACSTNDDCVSRVCNRHMLCN